MPTLGNAVYSLVMAIVPLLLTGGCGICMIRAFCCCKWNPMPILRSFYHLWIEFMMLLAFLLFTVFYYFETIRSWNIDNHEIILPMDFSMK